ncbi:MAG TPA: hypothetical protein VH370_19240 [Humisphaera sp.]|jgi:hypothetical protein|nr:hypothetical protein [Humisphaera sp.]
MAKKKKKDALNYQRTEFYDIRPVPNLKTANFGGKTYRVLYGRSDQALGGCERRSRKRPRVFLDDRLIGVARLDVAIHEAIHACLGHRLGEAEAERVGRDVSRFIFRLYHADPERAVVARCDAEGEKPLVNKASLRWVPRKGKSPQDNAPS